MREGKDQDGEVAVIEKERFRKERKGGGGRHRNIDINLSGFSNAGKENMKGGQILKKRARRRAWQVCKVWKRKK